MAVSLLLSPLLGMPNLSGAEIHSEFWLSSRGQGSWHHSCIGSPALAPMYNMFG